MLPVRGGRRRWPEEVKARAARRPEHDAEPGSRRGYDRAGAECFESGSRQPLRGPPDRPGSAERPYDDIGSLLPHADGPRRRIRSRPPERYGGAAPACPSGRKMFPASAVLRNRYFSMCGSILLSLGPDRGSTRNPCRPPGRDRRTQRTRRPRPHRPSSRRPLANASLEMPVLRPPLRPAALGTRLPTRCCFGIRLTAAHIASSLAQYY